MMSTAALDFRVPSDLAQIEAIVAQVVHRCRECRFDARLLSLTANAMVRGNGEDVAKEVRVRAEVSEVRLVIEVEDEGAGFDLDACCVDPTTPERLEREDGRGLFLMRALMDEVVRVEGAANVVRLTLRRR
jgi:serine/threonine-protein kinase RsbW